MASGCELAAFPLHFTALRQPTDKVIKNSMRDRRAAKQYAALGTRKRKTESGAKELQRETTEWFQTLSLCHQ